MEFDRDKLPASIGVAEKAIHQRLRGLPIANSKEHRELRDALNSLAVLKKYTFGVLKHFLFGLRSNYCGIDPAYRASPTSQCAAHNCRKIAISRATAGWRICEMKLYARTPPAGPTTAARSVWASSIAQIC